jgi:hypothetical protein
LIETKERHKASASVKVQLAATNNPLPASSLQLQIKNSGRQGRMLAGF